MRRKQVLIRHFVETAATRTADIEILCVMFTDMLPILILFAGFNVLDVIAHVIRGKLNDAPTSIPLRSTHLCILMFMIVDAAVILILMCRNIVNVAIQIAQLL